MFFARVVGFPIISIKLDKVSILVTWQGQMVCIGIVLVREVGSINFSIVVVVNFGKGFQNGECSLIIGMIIHY
jgi:hypothetical protein